MACSSSIHASYLAINAIRTGDCHVAAVASVDWIADPNGPIAMDKLEAPSVLGHFFTFYGRAENYACSEGYGPIYQKQARSLHLTLLCRPNPGIPYVRAIITLGLDKVNHYT
jgi:acyl transferase domain-containing protein